MSIIGLGVNSSKYWFFVLALLFYLFRSYLFFTKECNAFIKVILMSIGMSLSLILEHISKKLQLNKDSTSMLTDNKSNWKTILAIFSCNLLDSIGFFLINFTNTNNTETTIPTVFYGTDELHIILQFFFVAIILFFLHKLIMHKHHFLFTIIMVIGLIVILISNLSAQNAKLTSNIILQIISSIIYAILLVIEKWVMEYKFVSPFKMVGLEGLFSFIISVIILLIFVLFINDSSFFDFNNEKEKLKDSYFIINAILFIFSSLGYNVFVMLITQNFGATNRVVADFISCFISLIINHIFGLGGAIEKGVLILLYVGYCFVFIGVVGFNEIIIFYCCGLGENTNKLISERSTYLEGMNEGDNKFINKSISLIQLDEQRKNEEEDKNDF